MLRIPALDRRLISALSRKSYEREWEDAVTASSSPIRKAFRMKVHPGHEAEYERRHRPIWEELADTLRSHGVSRYSIFLDPATQDLFAYAEIEDEARWAAIASTDVCRRWWQYMSDIMPSAADNSPLSRELNEVFRL